jgi:hypothetical protein
LPHPVHASTAVRENPKSRCEKEVVLIDLETTILIIMAYFAFTTLVLQIVEMTRHK